MYVNKSEDSEKKYLEQKKVKSIVREIPVLEGNEYLVRIAELTLHSCDVLTIAEELRMTVPEVIAAKETVEYFKAEQAVSRHLGKSVANKVKVLLDKGLDVIGEILDSDEVTYKDKLNAFNAVAKQVQALTPINDEGKIPQKSVDELALEGLDDTSLNQLSALTEEAKVRNE